MFQIPGALSARVELATNEPSSRRGRVTLTTALKPRPGTYALPIGATKLTVRLR